MNELQPFYVGIKAIIPKDKGVLLLKDRTKDQWEFPGGRVNRPQSDKLETVAELFARELEEEIPGSKLEHVGEAVHTAFGDHTFDNGYRLFLVFYITEVVLPETIQLSDEHTDHAIATPHDFKDFTMFTTDQAALEKYFAGV